jgi:hypothetical protein
MYDRFFTGLILISVLGNGLIARSKETYEHQTSLRNLKAKWRWSPAVIMTKRELKTGVLMQ